MYVCESGQLYAVLSIDPGPNAPRGVTRARRVAAGRGNGSDGRCWGGGSGGTEEKTAAAERKKGRWRKERDRERDDDAARSRYLRN